MDTHCVKTRHRSLIPTAIKVERDAEVIRRSARFVIELHNNEARLIDNGSLKREGLPYARLIAVLGEVEYRGKKLWGILLEIGYSRTRPYAKIECGGEREKGEDGKASRRVSRSWTIQGRTRARPITDDELKASCPMIFACMARVVLEGSEHWKQKGLWWAPGEWKGIERGIRFTVSRADTLLHEHFLREDIRFRKKRYISGHRRRAARYLRKYLSSYHTAKQLRSFPRAQDIASMLTQAGYTPLYRAALIRSFQPGSHERSLLELIAEAFKINIELDEKEERVLSRETLLPKFVDIRCYCPPRQPTKNANDATVFEIILAREYRERNEVPF